MAHKKPNLPTKVCPICQRPFAWRKKWERVWDEVKYCSDRCRRERKKEKGQKRKDAAVARPDTRG